MSCLAFNIINGQIKTLRAEHHSQERANIAALRKMKEEITSMLTGRTGARG